MFKTHLDVGFTDLASRVRRRYLEDFFPRALSVASELRARGGSAPGGPGARLRWTTGSWILTEALDAASPAHRRELEAAVEAGDLCWHALPFTLHTEYCDRSLLEHGLSLSAELDRRYGRRTVAAKVTDVPGHTRGLVSLLADAGVELLHVGVNPASAAPSVPDRFRWQDPAADEGPELLVMYQPGGYGSVQVVPGTRTAVAVELTGDNLGPPSADDVTAIFETLGQRFPGASVRASVFDEVAAVMSRARDDLPVIDDEIGDSWIHGVASDPAKTTTFRALCRERVRWIDSGEARVDDPALRAASTRLLLVAEHTWGLDLKTHWPDETHWSAADLAVVRDEAATARFESSWAEQRGYLTEFVDALAAGGRPDLAARAAAVADGATVQAVDEAVETVDEALTGGAALGVGAAEWTDVAPDEAVGVGGFVMTLDPSDGAVVGLVGPDGRSWASVDSPLARWTIQTFDAADFERWFSTYNAQTTPEDLWWARWDNTKPGLDGSGARSAWWSPRLVSVRRGHVDGRDVVVAALGVDAEPDDPVAVPASARLTLRAGERPDELDVELSWFGLRAARWPVAWWWTFAPLIEDPSRWRMHKLGEWVAPDEVVPSGGGDLHAADRLAHPDGLGVELWDTPLVAPGAPRLLDWDPDEGPHRVDSRVENGQWHVCVHANLWGTNFPMWTEGDGRARVTLRFPTTSFCPAE